ncbi:MAG TPA: ABC transporter ATP-binding protein [Blastocatellia bacterium]|nr:ABC transporter ATP-binding protein [Blastocatellia bacterium]
MPNLELENVSKTYETGNQRVEALRSVSITTDAGDFVAVMGPSGCGKSTLLHLIGGMDRPTGGTITLAGRDLTSLTDDELARTRRTEIGFVFQFFNLLPTLTVIENVALPLTLDGCREREARERARRMLDRVGLGARETHRPAQLSGGEMQRAAVARAVICEPKIVLADEPTGNLDTENGEHVLTLIEDINRELGVTVILATHSVEAARSAMRVIRLRDGVLEQIIEHEAGQNPVLPAV